MYGQALQQSPWQRIRDESLANRQRARAPERSRAGKSVTETIKSVLVFLWCLLYSVFNLAASLGMLIGTVLAVPLVVFGALAIIGLILHTISLLLSGIGLV